MNMRDWMIRVSKPVDGRARAGRNWNFFRFWGDRDTIFLSRTKRILLYSKKISSTHFRNKPNLNIKQSSFDDKNTIHHLFRSASNIGTTRSNSVGGIKNNDNTFHKKWMIRICEKPNMQDENWLEKMCFSVPTGSCSVFGDVGQRWRIGLERKDYGGAVYKR